MSASLRDILRSAPREGGQKLGLTICEVSKIWRQLIDLRLMHLGVSNARWTVLLALNDFEKPVSQKVLAEYIGIEGPTLVRMLDSLESDGLVRRKPSKKDRRVKLVELCKKTDELLDSMLSVAIGIQKELIQGIPEQDLVTCHKVLLTIKDRLSTQLDKKSDHE